MAKNKMKTKKMKTKKKSTESKRSETKAKLMKRKIKTRKPAKKSRTPKRKLAKRKPAVKKAVAKTKVLGKKATDAKTPAVLRIGARRKSRSADSDAFVLEGLRTSSGGQAGDLQGLSTIEGADSESVSELIEEGNAFEAEAVTGVERADDTDEKEIRTHEVPEDDVPGEYLDNEE